MIRVIGEAEEPLVQWVAQVRKLLDCRKPLGKISLVATHLLTEKPEFYIPQYVSLGPYHHWKLQKEIAASSSAGGSYQNRELLSPAEAYKLQSAATFWPKRDRNLDDIVENIRGKLQEIEEFYNLRITRNGEYPQQFALMMAIDLSFLLRFLLLQSGDLKYNGGLGHLRRLDEISVKCDILKLENQVPLAALKSVFNEALVDADDEYNFSNWLQMTCKELSPFQQFDIENNDAKAKINEQTHLLGCVHAFVSPLLNIIDHDNVPERSQPRSRVENIIKSFQKWLIQRAHRPDGTLRPVPFLGNMFLARICFPTRAFALVAMIEEFFARICVREGIKPPSIDILHSYNARELKKAGIKFKSFSKQPYGIWFDKNSGTLYLPRLTVSEMQTEVLFRNMLALEFNEEDAARGDSVMRYVGLIDCLIGTAEDVRLLRESRVILPLSITLTDEKIAGMWNGMCYPLFTDRLDPPLHLCSALKEVLIRKYYMKYFMRSCTNDLIKVRQIQINIADPFIELLLDAISKPVRFLSAPIMERLSDPGKGAAMLVGLLILFMTAVQTYCAFATFLKGN